MSDSHHAAAHGGQVSPSALRNAGPIVDVLGAHLPVRGRVLEIASGTGQHAVAALKALPGLDWTPSDPQAQARASIDAWRAGLNLAGLNPALDVDAMTSATWPAGPFDALVCVNMIHISPWAATEGLLDLAASRLVPGGLLYLYGPYLEDGVETAASNLAFDADLKRRNPQWGLRRREDVVAQAKSRGLAATLRIAMPANNLSLLFRRV